jgi:hypothetical protein
MRPCAETVTYTDHTGASTTFRVVGKRIWAGLRTDLAPPLHARIISEADIHDLVFLVSGLLRPYDPIALDPGVFHPKSGRAITCPGAQVIFWNTLGLTEEEFAKYAAGIAALLAKAYPPETFVEVRDLDEKILVSHTAAPPEGK